MNNGTVIVNGTDIGSAYNTFVSKGGYSNLVQWPALKAVRGNDWQELDGYEPDLSDIHLDTRELDVRFVCLGSVDNMKAFYKFLLSEPKMTYNFSDIGRTLTLRVLEMPSLLHAVTFNEVTVRFAADSPLEGYEYQSPSSSLPTKNDYAIDGTPLSSYGIRVLLGTVAGVIKGAAVKPLLVRNISVLDGATYDENPTVYEGGEWTKGESDADVTVRARDITLRCFMTGVKANVWRNYDALLYDLSKNDETADDSTLAGARRITIEALGATYGCFYKSQNVTEFTTDGTTVWLKFDLTLTLFSEEGSEGFF